MKYFLIKLIIFMDIIEILRSSIENNEDCSEDRSYGFLNKEFIWRSNGSGVYSSTPPCLNYNLEEVTRECRHNQWYPTDMAFCFEDICPENTISVNDSCFYLTEPRTYDNSCSDNLIDFVLYNNTTEYVWKTKSTDGCIIQYEDKIKYVDCNELYSHNCKYNRNDLFKSTNSLSDVDASLIFIENDRVMYLTIYTPESVKDLKDDIMCFTYDFHIEDDYTIRKVKVREIFDYRTEDDREDFNYRNFTIFKLDIKHKPLEYWCTLLVRSQGVLLVTDKTVGYKDNISHEFVMYIQVQLNNSNVPKKHFNVIEKFCDKIHVKCRAFELLDYIETNFTSYFLIHITTKYSESILRQYNKLNSKFNAEDGFKVINLTSSEFCLPTNSKSLSWPLTSIGSKAVSRKLCFTEYNMIAIRNCEGSFFHGAKWAKFKRKCLENITISNTTQFLFNLTYKKITTEIRHELSNIMDNPTNLTTMEIAFLSKALYKTAKSNFSDDVSEVFYKTVNNLFTINAYTLKQSQYILNSTDTILNALDIFLTKQSEQQIGNATNHLMTFSAPNFIIQITKPFLNNISGFALYGNSDSFLDCETVDIYKNQNLFDIELIDLQAAIFVPEKLLKRLVNDSEEAQEKLTIITAIFYNDTMFNEDSGNKSANSKVVSVNIPGYGSCLKSPIPMLFKRKSVNSNERCGYWSYGKNAHGKKGYWSQRGINYETELSNSSVVYCAFSHLTHFALLIMSERTLSTEALLSIVDIYALYNYQLSTITIVCSCITLVGIFGIFLTAIIFRKWREKLGTKFLLQLSITIVLEIILTQIAGLEDWYNSKSICTFIGILLHYSVLCKFAWMLVMAFLQYLRFVRVLGPMPSKLSLKSMIIGWLLPIIPVILTVSIYPNSYVAGIQRFCYPKGLALYLGLLLPAALMVSANIFVFVLVMRSIYACKSLNCDKSGIMSRRQFYLGILLFFLLGIHWIFGFLAELLPEIWLEIVFMYLFCFTAGLQGFVLFTFYVVLDKDTRLLWTNTIKNWLLSKRI